MSIDIPIRDKLGNILGFPTDNGMIRINISIIRQAYEYIKKLEKELELEGTISQERKQQMDPNHVIQLLTIANTAPPDKHGHVEIAKTTIAQAIFAIDLLQDENNKLKLLPKDVESMHEEAITTLLYRVLRIEGNKYGTIAVQRHIIQRALDTIEGMEDHIKRLKKKNQKQKKKIKDLEKKYEDLKALYHVATQIKIEPEKGDRS